MCFKKKHTSQLRNFSKKIPFTHKLIPTILLFIVSCTSTDILNVISDEAKILKSDTFTFKRSFNIKVAKISNSNATKRKKIVSSDCSYEKKIEDPRFIEKDQGLAVGKSNLWKSETAESLTYLPRGRNSSYTDWVASAKLGIIKPLGTLNYSDKEVSEYQKDTLMIVKSPLRNNVCFPHEIHTYWLGCDNCHPEIFVAKKNANPISMTKIIKGEFCGRCHGKVAFHVANNCHRCHNTPK